MMSECVRTGAVYSNSVHTAHTVMQSHSLELGTRNEVSPTFLIVYTVVVKYIQFKSLQLYQTVFTMAE